MLLKVKQRKQQVHKRQQLQNVDEQLAHQNAAIRFHGIGAPFVCKCNRDLHFPERRSCIRLLLRNQRSETRKGKI